MFAKFTPDARRLVADARGIAGVLGSPTLEAEHLLLALTRRPATAAQLVLAEAGLDEDALRDALAADFEATLAAVGVVVSEDDLVATVDRTRTPRWGASAALALRRGAKIASGRHDRRYTPAHVALAIVRAPAGTVPRALDRAGIDRVELAVRMEAALSAPAGH